MLVRGLKICSLTIKKYAYLEIYTTLSRRKHHATQPYLSCINDLRIVSESLSTRDIMCTLQSLLKRIFCHKGIQLFRSLKLPYAANSPQDVLRSTISFIRDTRLLWLVFWGLVQYIVPSILAWSWASTIACTSILSTAPSVFQPHWKDQSYRSSYLTPIARDSALTSRRTR